MIDFLRGQIHHILSQDLPTMAGLILANIIIFTVIFESLRMLKTILFGRFVSMRTSHQESWKEALQAENTSAAHGGKILVVGDSTAVGTGALTYGETLAGRFAHDFPNSQIKNVAVNGSLTHDVIRQLRNEEKETFDMIVISTGGNDIWHFSRLSKLRHDLTEALTAAKQMSSHRVILLLYNNIGDAPAFSPLVRGMLRSRGIKIHNLFRDIAAIQKVPYIELFTEEERAERNPFLNPQEQKNLFALDGIHPSGEGYRYWYNRMWSEMVRQGYRYR